MTFDQLAAKILVERYGMDGRGARSLEVLARELGVDRLELRRLEAGIVHALRELAVTPAPAR